VGALFLQALAAAPPGRALPNYEDLQPRLDALIGRLHQQAAALWTPVLLSLEDYAHHLAGSVASAPETGDVMVTLEALHASDLYLACAAGRGVPEARELFVRRFLSSITAAIQTIDGDRAFVDEVRQALHERLLLNNDGPPRILGYGGRAALGTWVGVAAQRLALGLVRSEGAKRRAAERAADEPWPVDLDPELQYLKARYRDDFKAALSAALSGLPERQRAVLRLYAVGGLTLARIAVMVGADESTVSRWIQRARDVVLEQTQHELERRLGVRISEIPSLARLVVSQLDVSVARLLGDDEGP
jgi:RNA polymerase sigma-70 factor (ECF subfamily)